MVPVVFVVDDDIDIRQGLKSLVGSVGLRCEVFASTQEFLPRKAADTVSCLVLAARRHPLGHRRGAPRAQVIHGVSGGAVVLLLMDRLR